MAITVYSESQIFDQTMAYFRAQFPTRDLSEYGFLGLIARAVAQDLVLVQDAIHRADNDGTPAYDVNTDGTIRSNTSSEALDFWAFVFGVASDVAGQYGRKRAIAASGGAASATGVAGTVIPLGTQAVDSTGAVTVQTTAAATVGAGGSVSVSLVAVTTGIAGNLTASSVITWVAPPAGLDSTATITTALTKGADREEDAALLARILQRLQNPPKGGTAGDFRRWAEESTDTNGATLGVDRGYVYPLRGGLGTCHIYVTQAGTGTGRQHGNAAGVQTNINNLRPVCCTIAVGTPYMPSTRGLKIRVRATASLSTYDYDWIDGAISTSIVSATASTIVISTANFIAALKNAIDASRKPRIQVLITTSGATATPYVKQVASYQTDVPAVGQTTLTLVSGQTFGVVPTAGDLYYAGAGFVSQAAQAILDYVDDRGPSRNSGYADSADAWDDVVRRSQIVKTVLNVKDSDGTAFIKDTPALQTSGVEIAIGAGAYSLNDFTPTDSTVTGAEMAWVQRGGIAILRSA